jgi:hypothetical protein
MRAGVESGGHDRGVDDTQALDAIDASRPLRRIPAIVSFLNPQPSFSLVGANRSSCPTAAV